MFVDFEAHHEWFENLKTDTTQIGFSIETLEDNILRGPIFLRKIDYHNNRAMIAVFIGEPEYRGKGYGRESISLVVDYGFNHLNLNRIGLFVSVDNKQALECYKSCKFKIEGILKEYFYYDERYHDAYAMSVFNHE